MFKYSSYRLMICFTFYIYIFFNNWYKVDKDIRGGYLLVLNLSIKVINGKVYRLG